MVSITTSASLRIGAISVALAPQPFAHRPVVAQRMRPARLAEPAQQRLIGGLDENQRRGHFAPNLLVERRQTLELFALARVHQQRGALNFRSCRKRATR